MTLTADILALNPTHYLTLDNSAVDSGSESLNSPPGLVNGAAFEAVSLVKGANHSLNSNAGYYDAGTSDSINLGDNIVQSVTYLMFASVSAIDAPSVIWKTGGYADNMAIVCGFGGGHQAMTNASSVTPDFFLNSYSTRVLETNRVYLFAMTWERANQTGGAGTRCRYYINGVLESENTNSSTQAMPTHAGRIMLGNSSDDLIFYGGQLPVSTNLASKSLSHWAVFANSLSPVSELFSLFAKWSLATYTVTNQAEVDAIPENVLASNNIALEVDVAASLTLDISRFSFQDNDIDIRYTGTGILSLQTPQTGLTTYTSDGSGSITIVQPSVSFTASNLTSSVFDNVRAGLFLVPSGAAQISDNGSVSSGAINFGVADVNTANNTITLSGIAGKVAADASIRFFGTDPPAPIDTRAVYYPSVDYDGSDNLSISGTPGGATIDLTNTGSEPQAGSDLYCNVWSKLDIQLLSSPTADYIVDLSAASTAAGVTLANGDVLVLKAVHHDAPGTGGSTVLSSYAEESFQYQGASITTLRSLSEATSAMVLLQELGADGSQVSGYSFDASTPGKVQVDVSKTTINTSELVAFYFYTQWLEPGLTLVRGNIEIENLNSVAVRGELTIDASSRSVWGGAFTYRLDGKSLVADESSQISFNWQNTRAAIIEKEVAIDLPTDVLAILESTLYLASQIPSISAGSGLTAQQTRDAMKLAPSAGTPAADSIDAELDTLLSSGGSGGDATAANQTTIINRLAGIEGSGFDTATDSLEALRNRGDAEWTTATGFSTHSAADVWAVSTREVTGGTIDINNDMRGTDNALLAASYTAPDNAGIAAIPTNPLLTNDSRLNNLNAPIGSIPTNPLTALPSIPTNWITADGIASDAITEIQTGLATPGDIPSSDITGIKAKTDQLAFTVANQVDANALAGGGGDDAATIYNYFNVSSRQDAFKADVSGLSTLTPAQVNAEMVDVLTIDTFPEPTAAPSATSSLKDKIAWVFILARNKITQTATTQAVRNDGDTTDVATSTTSDDGTTFTRGEWQ